MREKKRKEQEDKELKAKYLAKIKAEKQQHEAEVRKDVEYTKKLDKIKEDNVRSFNTQK